MCEIQAKALESVQMIGTQCRCVGSRCHLEKEEWVCNRRETGGGRCPSRKKEKADGLTEE